jgi:hypothetical protein
MHTIRLGPRLPQTKCFLGQATVVKFVVHPPTSMQARPELRWGPSTECEESGMRRLSMWPVCNTFNTDVALINSSQFQSSLPHQCEHASHFDASGKHTWGPVHSVEKKRKNCGELNPELAHGARVQQHILRGQGGCKLWKYTRVSSRQADSSLLAAYPWHAQLWYPLTTLSRTSLQYI